MKKSFILVGVMAVGYANAQEGKVGINTDTPSATLQVKSQTGTDNKTKNLELENANATKLVTVLDNGYVGIGTDAPYARLHIVSEGTPDTAGPVSANDLVYEYFENGATSTLDPVSVFFRRYGGKIGALSNIRNNTTIGNILFQGYYNNNTNHVSELRTTYTSDGTTATARLHMGILGSTSDLVINRETNGGTTNVGIGTLTPTEKLDVNGNIRSFNLRGTGTRNVVADENGVLQIGSATATPAVEIGSTTGMQCNAENRGKMNFIPNDSGNDIFGICLRNKDGNYYWGYMVGGNNPTNGTGAFGSGL